MKSTFTTKKIAGAGIFTAIVVVLQLFSNYVSFGPVSITLALIPIALGAMLYGPLVGLWLGLVMGGLVLTAPTTVGFLTFNPLITVILCLVKGGMAGLVCGLIYKIIRRANEKVATVICGLSVPIVNTGLFVLGAVIFFVPLIQEWAGDGDPIKFLFITMIGINFLIEFAVTVILTPTVNHIMNAVKLRHGNKAE